MSDHNFGLLSLLPPLVAIALAIALRQVVIPLLLAIACGAIILTGIDQGAGHLIVGSLREFVLAIWKSVFDYDHLRALVFSLTLGAMVGVLEAGGGMVALVNRFAKRIRSRRGAQTMIASLGLGIFFDDYANTLLVGGTMRSTADRFGISRAKLSYLVDTTSAPVAGLSPISTWVVTEISLIATALAAASIVNVSAFALLIASIPFRFYPILALVMVFTIAASDRDFGPMKDEVGHEPADDSGASDLISDVPSPAAVLGWAALIPIIGCVSGVIAWLYYTGVAEEADQASIFDRLGDAIKNGDSYGSLICGGMIGLALAVCLHRLLGRIAWGQLGKGALRGAGHMIPAMAILWLAWALSDQTNKDHLNTGGFIASLLSARVPPYLLPTAVFLISAGVAFSTGTSWGTMAILIPIAMELAVALSGGQPYNFIALATLGSVLAGSIFGDHCSPISDTTVLSSRASGCDHITHVRTQMPYALSVGLVSVICGTIPAALGVSAYVCLVVGIFVTIGIVFALGKKAV